MTMIWQHVKTAADAAAAIIITATDTAPAADTATTATTPKCFAMPHVSFRVHTKCCCQLHVFTMRMSSSPPSRFAQDLGTNS